MAQRVRSVIPVDGSPVEVCSDEPLTVRQALQASGKTEASSVVIDAEIVRPEDYERRVVPPTGLITNQVPISKGGEASVAKRVRQAVPIGGSELTVYSGGALTVAQALEAAGKSDASSVVIDAEIIEPEDYERRVVPPTGLITNQVPISKGDLRSRLLAQEVQLIEQRFLAAFAPPPKRRVRLDRDWLLIENFPLPDGYQPDYIDLTVITFGYPDVPPAGVHVPADDPGRLSKIREALRGHVFRVADLPAGYRDRVEELDALGMEWLCYHYEDWQWNLDPRDLLRRDCLFKYIENVYAALCGGHR